MSTTSKAGRGAPRDYRVRADSAWAGAWKIAFGVGALGLAAGAYGYTQDATRFAFSYLFAFFLFLTIGLGGLFFVIIQYLTKAGWSITVRRSAEFFMGGLWVFLILVVPIALMMGRLFPWLDGSPAQASAKEAAVVCTGAETSSPCPSGTQCDVVAKICIPSVDAVEDGTQPYGLASPSDRWLRDNPPGPKAVPPPPDAARQRIEKHLADQREVEETNVLNGKKPYLNPTFFLIRLVGYVVIWTLLSMRLFRWSTEQDKTKKADNTARAQKFAPLALALFAVTITFAAFDWLMSLQPTWYSTIFGVYIFAGSAVTNMAVLVIFTLLLRRSGALGNAVSVEHYHDMGKLLFGWLVFWAYISFSQFFLIWYSNIPEELVFFHRRWSDAGGTWKQISLAIIIFHFIVPFWLLMSRNVKRRVQLLAAGAAILIVMHIVEVYWLVMPNFPGSGPEQYVFAPHWLDIACFIGVGGIYLGAVLRLVAGHPLIPIGDPRLVRALKFENA